MERNPTTFHTILRDGRTLIPSLRTLKLKLSGSVTTNHLVLRTFIVPTLASLGITCTESQDDDTRDVRNILVAISNSRDLTSVAINGLGSASRLFSPAVKLSDGFRRLRSLEITLLQNPQCAFEQLAQLTSLRSLTVTNRFAGPDRFIPKSTLPAQFSSLKRFQVSVFPAAEVGQILSGFDFHRIVVLQISFLSAEVSPDVLRRLAETCPLVIDLTLIFSNDKASTPPLSYTDIRPIISKRPSLRNFILAHAHPVTMTDSDAVHMATSLQSSIKILVLNFTSSGCTPSSVCLSIGAIFPFAKMCRNLTWLGLHVNPTLPIPNFIDVGRAEFARNCLLSFAGSPFVDQSNPSFAQEANEIAQAFGRLSNCWIRGCGDGWVWLAKTVERATVSNRLPLP